MRMCSIRKGEDVVNPIPAQLPGAAQGKEVVASEAAAVKDILRSIGSDDAKRLYNLRSSGGLSDGSCMYIQSGDTSDFDGTPTICLTSTVWILSPFLVHRVSNCCCWSRTPTRNAQARLCGRGKLRNGLGTCIKQHYTVTSYRLYLGSY